MSLLRRPDLQGHLLAQMPIRTPHRVPETRPSREPLTDRLPGSCAALPPPSTTTSPASAGIVSSCIDTSCKMCQRSVTSPRWPGHLRAFPVPTRLRSSRRWTVLRPGLRRHGHRRGRVVLQHRMTGYQEIMTDPSYAGQIVTFTFPHVGNVGVNPTTTRPPTRSPPAWWSNGTRPSRRTGAPSGACPTWLAGADASPSVASTPAA